MSRSIVIARRELSSYFYSPIAYVAMALFLLVAGFLFWRDFQPGKPVAMRTIFDWMVWLLVFIVPVLCMGLLAQEWLFRLDDKSDAIEAVASEELSRDGTRGHREH